MRRIIIAISGATGVIYGIKLLEALQHNKLYEIHLLITPWAERIIQAETNISVKQVKKYASYYYAINDFTAPIASGSFKTDGMVVVPCSMKTLSAIAHGYADNLMTRSADVMIKEKRKLILVPRETPLSAIHLENMVKLARLGIVILPPLPAFYYQPTSLNEMIDHLTSKILDHLGIENHLYKRWGEEH
jgi:4-hydroxy-3-polyprenylbenzoate decarboxylase